MGPVITNQPNTQELVSCEKREKRKPKMCNTPQQNPQQNQPWQGVYPDLSALNELFSPQAAVNSETSSSSPWIAFLSSLGLQPIPGPQQQARPAQEQPYAPPAPGTEGQDGQTFSGTNSAAWGQGQGYHQSHPQSPPQPNGHTCGYSCGAPHISQLLQAITSRLLHFSSVATRASVTFFCILAFLLPCLHRLHVRGQPLADSANWGVRFTGANAAWDQHMNHSHPIEFLTIFKLMCIVYVF